MEALPSQLPYIGNLESLSLLINCGRVVLSVVLYLDLLGIYEQV